MEWKRMKLYQAKRIPPSARGAIMAAIGFHVAAGGLWRGNDCQMRQAVSSVSTPIAGTRLIRQPMASVQKSPVSARREARGLRKYDSAEQIPARRKNCPPTIAAS